MENVRRNDDRRKRNEFKDRVKVDVNGLQKIGIGDTYIEGLTYKPREGYQTDPIQTKPKNRKRKSRKLKNSIKRIATLGLVGALVASGGKTIQLAVQSSREDRFNNYVEAMQRESENAPEDGVCTKMVALGIEIAGIRDNVNGTEIDKIKELEKIAQELEEMEIAISESKIMEAEGSEVTGVEFDTKINNPPDIYTQNTATVRYSNGESKEYSYNEDVVSMLLRRNGMNDEMNKTVKKAATPNNILSRIGKKDNSNGKTIMAERIYTELAKEYFETTVKIEERGEEDVLVETERDDGEER